MDVTVGVVCEGKTDFVIIEWCLRAAFLRHDVNATFLPMQPSRDMTSGSYSEGGWHQVFQWCVRNDAVARQRFFDGGLFSTSASTSVDLLVVHLDGDLVAILALDDLWRSVSTSDPSSYPQSTEGSRQFSHDLVSGWLYGAEPRQQNDKTVPLPIVVQSEAWLLGALGESDDPETLRSPKLEFAQFYLQSVGKKVPAKMRKLKHHHKAVEQIITKREPDTDRLMETAHAFRLGSQAVIDILLPP